MLPPIRYPLPSLIVLVLASLVAWKGAEWSRGWRSAIMTSIRRVYEGPPVPESREPRVVAGPMTRRALLLRPETPVAARPGGRTIETIRRRMFVDIYDTWPEPGPATHARIGNRTPIGWVPLSELLTWDTRLVIRVPGGRLRLASSTGGAGSSIDVGSLPLPVLAWTDRAVEVAVWDPAHPWSKVARRGWVGLGDLPPESWGILIGQDELPILLRLTLGGDPRIVRLRSILGRLTDRQTWTTADLEAARPALPPRAFLGEGDPRGAAQRLAEANARPTTDASWAGLSFRFLSLSDLP